MTKAQLETAIRNDVLATIRDCLAKKYDTDILTVSSSEITIPVVDAEGNEKFALIKVSIPRGARNGLGGYDEYDGYAVAAEYQEIVEEKQKRKQKKVEK